MKDTPGKIDYEKISILEEESQKNQGSFSNNKVIEYQNELVNQYVQEIEKVKSESFLKQEEMRKLFEKQLKEKNNQLKKMKLLLFIFLIVILQ